MMTDICAAKKIKIVIIMKNSEESNRWADRGQQQDEEVES